MDTPSALDALNDGDKARRPGWTVGSYIAVAPPEVVPTPFGPRGPVVAKDTWPTQRYYEGGIGAGVLFENTMEEAFADDWEILV